MRTSARLARHEIGGPSSYAQHAMVSARRKLSELRGSAKQRSRIAIDAAVTKQPSSSYLRVARDSPSVRNAHAGSRRSLRLARESRSATGLRPRARTLLRKSVQASRACRSGQPKLRTPGLDTSRSPTHCTCFQHRVEVAHFHRQELHTLTGWAWVVSSPRAPWAASGALDDGAFGSCYCGY